MSSTLTQKTTGNKGTGTRATIKKGEARRPGRPVGSVTVKSEQDRAVPCSISMTVANWGIADRLQAEHGAKNMSALITKLVLDEAKRRKLR